jgi:hypothetical protein
VALDTQAAGSLPDEEGPRSRVAASPQALSPPPLSPATAAALGGGAGEVAFLARGAGVFDDMALRLVTDSPPGWRGAADTQRPPSLPAELWRAFETAADSVPPAAGDLIRTLFDEGGDDALMDPPAGTGGDGGRAAAPHSAAVTPTLQPPPVVHLTSARQHIMSGDTKTPPTHQQQQQQQHQQTSSLFSTGRGAPVHMSAAALARGAAIVESAEAGNVQGSTPQPPPPPQQQQQQQQQPSSLFSTGAGKAMHLSAESLARGAAYFEGAGHVPNSTPPPAPPPPAPTGGAVSSLFSTGGGKAMHLSAAAQARMASFDGNDTVAPKPGPGGAAPLPTGGALGTPAPMQTAAMHLAPVTAPPRPGGGKFKTPQARTPLTHGGFLSPPPGAGGQGSRTFQPPKSLPARGGDVLATPMPAARVQAPASTPVVRAPAVVGPPLHDLHVGTVGRQGLRVFFGCPPFGTQAPPGFRVSSFDLSRVRPDAASLTSSSAADIRLPLPPPMDELTPKLAVYLLVEKHGAHPGLCSAAWVANHWRWISLKLAAYERAWPGCFSSGRALHASCMMAQLRYRYAREHGQGSRPVLRRVAEGDTAPGVAMCLFVAATRLGEQGGTVEVDLCDGWYPLRARLDPSLSACVRSGRLALGDKVLVTGAERGGDETAAPPLEAYSSMWLTLGVNTCRKAPWHTRLGIHKRLVLTPLRLVRPGGGAVPAVGVTITRVFPMLHMEAVAPPPGAGDDDEAPSTVKTVGRADAEALWAAKHAAAADAAAEAAAGRAREEWEAEQLRRPGGGRQQSYDEVGLRQRVEFEVQAALEEGGLTGRQVTPMLKLHVTGLVPVGSPGWKWPGEAVITIWRPDEQAAADLVEGRTFVVTRLQTGNGREGDSAGAAAQPLPAGRSANGGPLELSSGRGTTWLRGAPGQGPLKDLRIAFKPRTCVPLASLVPQAQPERAASPQQHQAGEAMAPAVKEARRLAAVNAALAGATPDAVNAAAAAAAEAAGAPPAGEAAVSVAVGAMFDSCAVLVHAAPVAEFKARGDRQVAFFVDASLAEGTGSEADVGAWAGATPMVVLERICYHKGGFVPLPSNTGTPFPVLAIAHATLERWDARCALVCASGSTLTQVSPPPRGSSGGLAAQTSAAAARLADWAQRNGQLLQALRLRAMRLTAEVGPHLAPPPVMPAAHQQRESPAPSPGRLRMSDDLQWSSQALREVHALEQAAADAAAAADQNPTVGWVGRHQGSPGEATLGTGDTLPVPTEFV